MLVKKELSEAEAIIGTFAVEMYWRQLGTSVSWEEGSFM